jgi:choline dehydrogenase-like flavoprotein
LTIAVNTTVDRIDFEGDKAIGVQASTSRGRETYTAGRETILALGSIATPKLLQLSGIGDRAELRSLGIEARVDSPNVGRRMREHRCFAIQFRLNRNVGYNRKLATPAQQALTGLQYLATRKGPLASGAYDVVGFFKTSPELDRPDAQILMAPFSAAPFEAGKELGLEREPGIQAIGYILRPDSEGHVAITSADPTAPLDMIGARVCRSSRPCAGCSTRRRLLKPWCPKLAPAPRWNPTRTSSMRHSTKATAGITPSAPAQWAQMTRTSSTRPCACAGWTSCGLWTVR